ncbi:hypothetical protein HDU91_003061 [Kappamyces sp. JEL0680]|nr:hypothetical protein HDU91_003061 [Kappamyces sp. JEL0680]
MIKTAYGPQFFTDRLQHDAAMKRVVTLRRNATRLGICSNCFDRRHKASHCFGSKVNWYAADASSIPPPLRVETVDNSVPAATRSLILLNARIQGVCTNCFLPGHAALECTAARVLLKDAPESLLAPLAKTPAKSQPMPQAPEDAQADEWKTEVQRYKLLARNEKRASFTAKQKVARSRGNLRSPYLVHFILPDTTESKDAPPSAKAAAKPSHSWRQGMKSSWFIARQKFLLEPKAHRGTEMARQQALYKIALAKAKASLAGERAEMEAAAWKEKVEQSAQHLLASALEEQHENRMLRTGGASRRIALKMREKRLQSKSGEPTANGVSDGPAE